MTEKELRDRIKAKRKEAEAAGAIHKRDLNREIRRLEKELMTYRYYRKRNKKDEKNNETRQRISA